MKNALVIFDFDGTLADTTECILAAVRRSYDIHGLGDLNEEALTDSIGLSLPKVLDAGSRAIISKEVMPELIETYRAEYHDLAEEYVQLFPGIHELVMSLRDQGHILTIATSKSRKSAEPMIDLYWGPDIFSHIIADEDVENKKPNPDMIHRLIEQTGSCTESVIMIGDTIYDIQMGKAAGVRTCGVSWGNHSREQLEGASPDYVVDSVDRLAGIITAP